MQADVCTAKIQGDLMPMPTRQEYHNYERRPRSCLGDQALCFGFATNLPLERDDILSVRVLPQCLRGTGLQAHQRLTRKTTIAIHLLQEEFGTSD